MTETHQTKSSCCGGKSGASEKVSEAQDVMAAATGCCGGKSRAHANAAHKQVAPIEPHQGCGCSPNNSKALAA